MLRDYIAVCFFLIVLVCLLSKAGYRFTLKDKALLIALGMVLLAIPIGGVYIISHLIG